jgi:7-cyano-7-deazaguanine synthase
MDENIVVLFSGGADSVLLMEMAKSMGKIPLAVMINYHQKHIEELTIAEKYCFKNKIKYEEIGLKNYNVRSGLTTGEKGIYNNVSEMNVPARNTIFLSIAAGISESNSINKVWIGCDMDDYYHKFPDCFQDYIGKINDLFKIAFSYPITVEAPLLGFSKENVLLMLKYYKIDELDIYSGYGEFT